MVRRKISILVILLFLINTVTLFTQTINVTITSDPPGADVVSERDNHYHGKTPVTISVDNKNDFIPFIISKKPFYKTAKEYINPTINTILNVTLSPKVEVTWLKSDRSSLKDKGVYIYNNLINLFSKTQLFNNSFNQAEKNYYMNANDSNAYSYYNDTDDFSVIKTVHLQQFWAFSHYQSAVGGPFTYDIFFHANIKGTYKSSNENYKLREKDIKHESFTSYWNQTTTRTGIENVTFDIYDAYYSNPIISGEVFERDFENYMEASRSWHWNSCDTSKMVDSYFKNPGFLYTELECFKSKSPILTINEHPDPISPINRVDENYYPVNSYFSKITLETEYRVKMIKAFFFDENGGYFDSIENKIDNYSDGINILDIPDGFIKQPGKYEMVVAVIDKFNKINYFKPQKFEIKMINIEVDKTSISFSNDGSNYFNNSSAGTLSDKIYLKFDVIVTNDDGNFINSNDSLNYLNDVINITPSDINKNRHEIISKTYDSSSKKITYKVRLYDFSDASGDGVNINVNFNSFIRHPNPSLSSIRVSNDLTNNFTITRYLKNMDLVKIDNITTHEITLKDPLSNTPDKSLISEMDEDYNSNDFEVDKEMFDITISFENEVDFVKVTIIDKQGKNKKYYYKTGRDFFRLNVNNELITKTIINLKYNESELSSILDMSSVSFPKIFNNHFTIKAEGIRLVEKNKLKESDYKENTDIETLFDGFLSPDEEACCIKQTGESCIKTCNPPPFPSRVVYRAYNRVECKDDIKLAIKPALTSQIDNGYYYKIITVIDNVKPSDTIIDNIFNGTSSYQFSKVNNSQWYVSSDGKILYSDFISNSSDTPIIIGTSDSPQIKFNGETLSFYVKLKYSDGGNDKLTFEKRYSFLKIDNNFISYKDPTTLFDGTNDVLIGEKVFFTKDVFIPRGKTLKFGVNSSMITELKGGVKKYVAGVLLDNNIKIVNEGTLIISNKATVDGVEYISQKVFFGPSGLEDSLNMMIGDIKNIINANGMWGGIYVLEDGVLDIDGADITAAYDGIVLYNNINKSTIKNCTIKYNEVGLHLYNSKLSNIINLNIEGNILYGLKEDVMSVINNVTNIYFFQNGYNYYKDGEGVIK